MDSIDAHQQNDNGKWIDDKREKPRTDSSLVFFAMNGYIAKIRVMFKTKCTLHCGVRGLYQVLVPPRILLLPWGVG